MLMDVALSRGNPIIPEIPKKTGFILIDTQIKNKLNLLDSLMLRYGPWVLQGEQIAIYTYGQIIKLFRKSITAKRKIQARASAKEFRLLRSAKRLTNSINLDSIIDQDIYKNDKTVIARTKFFYDELRSKFPHIKKSILEIKSKFMAIDEKIMEQKRTDICIKSSRRILIKLIHTIRNMKQCKADDIFGFKPIKGGRSALIFETEFVKPLMAQLNVNLK
jgi:hypothetical protein